MEYNCGDSQYKAEKVVGVGPSTSSGLVVGNWQMAVSNIITG